MVLILNVYVLLFLSVNVVSTYISVYILNYFICDSFGMYFVAPRHLFCLQNHFIMIQVFTYDCISGCSMKPDSGAHSTQIVNFSFFTFVFMTAEFMLRNVHFSM
jgi:hypothetical protein